jgi:hypothetical protein
MRAAMGWKLEMNAMSIFVGTEILLHSNKLDDHILGAHNLQLKAKNLLRIHPATTISNLAFIFHLCLTRFSPLWPFEIHFHSSMSSATEISCIQGQAMLAILN